jgi:hypothetical protein
VPVAHRRREVRHHTADFHDVHRREPARVVAAAYIGRACGDAVEVLVTWKPVLVSPLVADVECDQPASRARSRAKTAQQVIVPRKGVLELQRILGSAADGRAGTPGRALPAWIRSEERAAP